jgi:hypothetical protein
MTTLNMSVVTKSRIEKRVEDAEKMVEEMKSEIENGEIENAGNLADLGNATKDAGVLWANLSREIRLITFEREVYHLEKEKMVEKMKKIAGRLREEGVDVLWLLGKWRGEEKRAEDETF